MAQKQQAVLKPEYMNKFSCIGTACGWNCCADGWAIFVDKAAYQVLKNCKDAELQELSKKYLKRSKSSAVSEQYAQVLPNETGRCGFQDENDRCRIQLKLGEKALNHVCSVYPRTWAMIDGDLELSANLSCPHAARLALNDKDGMSFVRETLDVKTTFLLDGAAVKPAEELGALHYFHTVREYAIGLLQNRAFSLDDRLILLGLLHKRFADALAEDPGADLAAIQFNFETQLASGVSAALLAKMKPEPLLQARLTKELVDQQIMFQKGTPRYRDLIGKSLYGMGSTAGATMKDVMNGYSEAYNGPYAAFTEERGHMLENFLVNEYFRQRMPFGKFKSIWESYVFLCVLYAITRMHLVGLAGYHKGLEAETAAMLISSLSREILHNAKFIESFIDLLRKSDAMSLAHMVILVKPPASAPAELG